MGKRKKMKIILQFVIERQSDCISWSLFPTVLFPQLQTVQVES